MSIQLLDKTRKINKLLHNNSHSKVVFNDICAVLADILDSNILELVMIFLGGLNYLKIMIKLKLN